MPLTAQGFSILGVTVHGPAPLGPVDLELSPGVTTLYGRNGAGKTRLLRAIRNALTGRRHDIDDIAMIHLQLLDREEPLAGGFLDVLRNALADGLREQRQRLGQIEVLLNPEDDAFEAYGALAERTNEFADATWPDLARNHVLLAGGEYELADWVGWSGCLSLVAAGTEHAPAWDVYVSCPYDLGDREMAFVPAFDAARRSWEVLFKAERGTDVTVTGEPVSELLASGLAALFVRRGLHAEDRALPVDQDLPSWVPVPVARAGTVTTPPADTVLLTNRGGDPDQLSRATMTTVLSTASAVGHRDGLLAVIDDEVEFSPSLVAARDELQARVQRYADLLLHRAPRLLFDLRAPDRWMVGRLPIWLAVDTETGHPVPLAETSQAQHRWLTVAVELALTDAATAEPRPRLVLADEPEAGLHRTAERHLADGLHELARELTAGILVASHSPALLDDVKGRPVHVTRTGRGAITAAAAPLLLEDRIDLAALREAAGLEPADLLQLLTVAVLVEGVHDRVVLEHLLSDDLRHSGIKVFEVHGAKHIRSLAEARILLDFTDARVLLVLDNLQHAEVDRRWREASTALSEGRRADAERTLLSLRDLDGGEPRWLCELGISCLQRLGSLDRVRIFGLSQPDVICYLPARAIVPGQSSWEPLIAQWRAEARAAGQSPRDLKKWVKRRHPRAGVGLRAIEQAAKQAAAASHVPDELLHLAVEIRGLALARPDW